MTTEAPPAPAASPATSQPPRTARKIILFLLLILAIIALLWSTGSLKPRPKVALVTAGQGPYWDMIVRGAQDSAARNKVRLDVVRPKSDEPSQTEAIKNLVGKGYDGVAISPNDPPRQAAALAQLAQQSSLVTFDSDSPVSNRLCFIGTNNYDAGQMTAEHIKQAVPDGGEIIICIGSLEKDNAQRRRQGVIDGLLDRAFDPNSRMDAVDAPLGEKGKYKIVATIVDGIDPAKATELAAEAIKKHPDLKCFACMFAYSTPSVLKALEASGKLGKIQVVGFDANDETLAGIEQGNVYASMIQDPYNIAYQAVRILADAARGKKEELPMLQAFFLPCDPVTKANIEMVKQDVARKRKPATQPAAVASGE